MRILLFLGFLVLSVLVPVGLAQAQAPVPPDLLRAESLVDRAGLGNISSFDSRTATTGITRSFAIKQ